MEITRDRDDQAWKTVPCDIRGYRRSHKNWTKIFGDSEGLWFLHYCGNGKCWEPRHVYLGTQSDNWLDLLRDDPDFVARRTARIVGWSKGGVPREKVP